MKRKLLLLTFALPLIMSATAIAQNGSRLVAQSHWRHNGAIFRPVDTSFYNYSGSRGGDLTSIMKYDDYTTMTFTGDTAYNTWHSIQTFDSSGNVLTTVMQHWDSAAGWLPVTNYLYTYNALNQITTMIMQTWNGSMWVPMTQNVYSYDAGHVLYSNMLQSWNSFTLNWDPASQETYYYDAYHNLVNETDQTFIAGVPVYTTQYGYAYDANSMLLTTTVSMWDGATWAFDSLYSNTYDSVTGNVINMLGQTYDAVASVWMNQTLHLYSNFIPGTHIPQTDVYQTWDSTGSGVWKNVIQYTNTYNGHNQLTSSTGTSWNVTGLFQFAVGDPMAKYYYADYVTAVKSVTNVSVNGGEASIYPVPAQNMLHIDVKWDAAQPATISIYDMQGRTVRQWDAPAGKEYRSAVSVDNLGEGVYFVKIIGTQNQIVKQIVVTH